MKIGVTGHRSERLKGKQESIEYWLKGQFKNLRSCYDDIELITGMAQGVDQIAAFAALDTGVDVRCYFPYKHKLSQVEEFIAEHAIEVRYECKKYQKACYFKRDRRIVDDCDLLIVVWDGIKNGGTYYTYQYALEKGRNVLIYPWKN